MTDKACAILQPHYLPWIGYFEMIDRVDMFVFLDDVQFIKREWKNRNRIRKTHDHVDSKWLSVPINRADQRGNLNKARIFDREDWATRHLNAVYSVYRGSPYFSDVYPVLQKAINEHTETVLSELNIRLIKELSGLIGIDTKCLKSSDLDVSGRREEKLLNICKAINATSYLANNAATSYVGGEYFNRQGIGFATQDYEHPAYIQKTANQILTPLSHLSVIDFLFNVGIGPEALAVIRHGRPTVPENRPETQPNHHIPKV